MATEQISGIGELRRAVRVLNQVTEDVMRFTRNNKPLSTTHSTQEEWDAAAADIEWRTGEKITGQALREQCALADSVIEELIAEGETKPIRVKEV